MRNAWVAIGALNGLLAVAAGAFGAHALAEKLDSRALDVYRTAAQYHLIHSVAACMAGACINLLDARFTRWSGTAFLIGILIFSGSLYGLALSGVRWLGAITPIGGVAFMLGWLFLAIAAIRTPGRTQES